MFFCLAVCAVFSSCQGFLPGLKLEDILYIDWFRGSRGGCPRLWCLFRTLDSRLGPLSPVGLLWDLMSCRRGPGWGEPTAARRAWFARRALGFGDPLKTCKECATFGGRCHCCRPVDATADTLYLVTLMLLIISNDRKRYYTSLMGYEPHDGTAVIIVSILIMKSCN